VAEAFGVACAEEPEPFLSRSRIRLSRARAEMIRELSELGFRVLPSAANFLSAKAPLSGEELAMRLAPLRILIRRCANFGMDDRWVRLAVKDPGTNRRLLDALRGVITASGRGAPV
jgi:histidinol-phosphate aminotransferase